jgi:prophage antirepressor-like protein
MRNVRILDRRDILGKIVTAYGTVAKPLFLAGEVAEWLDIGNVSQMLQNVDDDEKVKLRGCLSNSYTPGGGARMNIPSVGSLRNTGFTKS